MCEIKSEHHWRVSKSGFSIKVGWSDNYRIVCQYPYKANPIDPDTFQQWIEDAELICELQNFCIDLEENLNKLDKVRIDNEYFVNVKDVINSLKQRVQGQCEHGKGLTDYCEPCGRINND